MDKNTRMCITRKQDPAGSGDFFRGGRRNMPGSVPCSTRRLLPGYAFALLLWVLMLHRPGSLIRTETDGYRKEKIQTHVSAECNLTGKEGGTLIVILPEEPSSPSRVHFPSLFLAGNGHASEKPRSVSPEVPVFTKSLRFLEHLFYRLRKFPAPGSFAR